jgi:hypothetical protein
VTIMISTGWNNGGGGYGFSVDPKGVDPAWSAEALSLSPCARQPGPHPFDDTTAFELSDCPEDLHLICAEAHSKCYVPVPNMWRKTL